MFGQDPVYLQLEIQKSVDVDAGTGNYIIQGEASNENLDLQEQVVLQRALLNSKDYFLTNGVVSWDHLHKRKEGEKVVSDPECVIGEPLSVERVGNKTFVKAMLYKGNKYVEDVVSKLRKKSSRVKLSVGGLQPVIEKAWDPKLRKTVEKVVSVLWNDLAVTLGPVNHTVSPIQLVKSLQLGYGTDSASMTGGRALVAQDLDGSKDDLKKKAIKAVIVALTTGDCTDVESARSIIRENGVMDDKIADDILEAIVNGKTKIKGVFGMDDAIQKSLDDSIAELEKALKPEGVGKTTRAAKVPVAPDDDELYEDDDTGEEGEGEYGEGGEGHYEPDGDEMGDGDEFPMAPVRKSIDDYDDENFLDVSADIINMKKSLDFLVRDNAELRSMITGFAGMMKSIGDVQLASARMLKSISDEPQMRKSVLSRNPRSFGGGSGNAPEEVGLDREEILRRTGIALQQGKMDLRKSSIIEDRLNANRPLDQSDIALLKSIQ